VGETKREAAIAFLVDRRGEILDVLRDDVGLPERLRPGRPLTGLVDPDSLTPALRFLRALYEQSSAFGHELVLRHEEEVVLTFGGVATARGLLVVGATSTDLVTSLQESFRHPPEDDAIDLGGEAEESPDGSPDLERSTVDDLVALCRRVVSRHDEVRRLRAESATCLREAAADLRRLALALRARPEPWPESLRGHVGDALLACALLLAELAADELPGE